MSKFLVVNTGSTSLKFAVFEYGEEISKKTINDLPINRSFGLMMSTLKDMEFDAVIHRVVHGGLRFTAPTELTQNVLKALEELNYLAPQHNPQALHACRQAQKYWPHARHIAIFDTAFHSTIPEYAYRYAIPDDLYYTFGMRKYGFHGISHQYMTRVATEELGFIPNLITIHLGGGCSVTAIRCGKSVDTTMGFSPLSGLPMATRCGDLDPALVMQAMRDFGPSFTQKALTEQSGLKGLCGESDMEKIVTRAMQEDTTAAMALDIYCYAVVKAIGSMAAILPTVDALVFSGGVGQNSSYIRSKIIDMIKPRPLPEIIVVPANEEREMVIQTAEYFDHDRVQAI